jgi:hypothetical protein
LRSRCAVRTRHSPADLCNGDKPQRYKAVIYVSCKSAITRRVEVS